VGRRRGRGGSVPALALPPRRAGPGGTEAAPAGPAAALPQVVSAPGRGGRGGEARAPPGAAGGGGGRRGHFFFFSDSQLMTLSSLYVRVHESCPTPLYSVYLGLPPAFSMALIMSRERSTLTAPSLSPWKHQMGILAILVADFTLPPPQMGMAAANRSGFLTSSA